jgi:hypothetical protein
MSKFPTIKDENGKEISFREYLANMSGSGIIFDEICEEIINKAVNGEIDWMAVDDYYGPVVHELLLEAVQEDADAFKELATVVKSVYQKLKGKTEEVPLVPGIDPNNRLESKEDLESAILDICTKIEKQEDAGFACGAILNLVDYYLEKHHPDKK